MTHTLPRDWITFDTPAERSIAAEVIASRRRELRGCAHLHRRSVR
jgi:hypothetical protein